MKRSISLFAAMFLACVSARQETVATPPASSAPIATSVAPPPSAPAAVPIPLWPEVTKGTLPNGLTYYLLRHGKPEKRATLWLAVNAGSVDEDEDQRGLAHFAEHMAFNGTKRYPKQAIIDTLQTMGMRFGADVNAYTTWQQTVYQLEVPTEPALISKGLDILHEWASDVSYDEGEVKSESGVVLEEWRLGRSAGMRLFDKHAKVLFKGTRYADRLTIGSPEILKKADRAALFRFYKDWYRPDNLAVIAVGDFDPKALEDELRARFGDLTNPAKERQRVPGGVPKPDGTRISIETDQELPGPQLEISNLIPHRPAATLADLRRSMVEELYTRVMNERFGVLTRRPNAPFVGAFANIGAPVREIDAFRRLAQVKNGKVEQALRSVLTEALRVERHGITQRELERAKIVAARAYDASADGEQTIDSRSLTDELSRNFLTEELVVGAVAERDLRRQLLPLITIDEINADVKSFGGAENRVFTISLPQGQPPPTEERITQIVAEVQRSEIPPWVEKPPPTTLMATAPAPGRIVKEKRYQAIGVTDWTLSNGAHVIVKPSDFKKDSVIFTADSPGGTALASDSDFASARFATTVATFGGVGDLDAETLTKVLAGKAANVMATISETREGLSGTASPKDLETLFQLAYLRVTAPRKDLEQFKVWRASAAEQIANQERSPEFRYLKLVQETVYKSHPRRLFPSAEAVAAIDQDKALDFYKARFGDVGDWNFVIVGDLEPSKLRPLVETYLASLPSKGRLEKEKDLGIRKVGGVVRKQFELGIEPKASVRLDFHGDDRWSRDGERDLFTLTQVLSNTLREELREAMGGVYAVGATGSLVRSPHQERSVTISFGCAPERVDELITATREEITKLATAGIDEDHLAKIRQIYLRSRETELRTNEFWSQQLVRAFRYHDDPNDIPDTSKTLARMTSTNVQAAAKRFLDPASVYEVVRVPSITDKAAASPGGQR